MRKGLYIGPAASRSYGFFGHRTSGIQYVIGLDEGYPEHLPAAPSLAWHDLLRASPGVRRTSAASAWPSMRSLPSLRLEVLVRRCQRRGQFARLADLNLDALEGLSDWIAFVRPDASLRRLTIIHAGAGLSAMQAKPLTGTDMLDLVDPAIKGEAFDSTMMMLSRPCGLWQLLPVWLADGSADMCELTGLPIVDGETGVKGILFLIWHGTEEFRRVRSAGQANVWSWLDLRFGAQG